MKTASWYNLEDRSGDSGDRVDNYGLLRHDGSRKPAFDAYRAAAEKLAAEKAARRR